MANPQITSTAEQVGNQALSAIPVVGPFLASIAGKIEGIFSQAHQRAIQQENKTLNTYLPAFYQILPQIVSEVEDGMLSIAQGQAAIDQLVASYYASVQKVMKRSGPCTHPANKPLGVHGAGFVSGGTCNAACVLGCDYIEQDAYNVKQLLASSGGVITIGDVPQGPSGVTGIPPIQISFSAPTVLTSIESRIEGALGIPSTAFGPNTGLLLLLFIGFAFFLIWRTVK